LQPSYAQETLGVISDAAKRRSGIQKPARNLHLDSGFALTRAPE
jgi:hypothetical protein